jgi:dihydroorotate dehydrogenase
MKPPEELSLKLAGLELCAPVGITGEVDEDGLGIGPLSLMGVGFLDLGVVTLLPRAGEVNRDPVNECLLADDPWVNPGARRLADRLGKTKSQVPLLVRLGFAPDANEEQALKERICLIRMLSPWIGAFVLDSLGQGGWPLGVWIRHVRELAGECARHGKPLMVAVSAYDEPMKRRVLEPGSLPGVEGLVITDVQPGSPARIGEMESGRMVIEWLENARAELDIPIIASGGVHEPADALRLLDAGANMVQVNSGVVFFGPGLVKRINEVVLWRDSSMQERKPAVSTIGWLSGALIGLCLVIIGSAAWWVAGGEVIMPYNEILSGLTRSEISNVNFRLLPFMAHDRVTLSGNDAY